MHGKHWISAENSDSLPLPTLRLPATALYTPVWTSVIRGRDDFGLAVAAFGPRMFRTLPSCVVVVVVSLCGVPIATCP